MAACVFVYEDGQVGLRDLPHNHSLLPVYREPVREPFKWSDGCDDLPMALKIREFTRRGSMFDGRPVFCADGFTTKEAYITAVTLRGTGDAESLELEHRRAIRKMAKHEYPGAIELDEWVGQIPAVDGDDEKRLEHRAVRLLVAIRG